MICLLLLIPLLEIPYLVNIDSESAFLSSVLLDALTFVPSIIFLWEIRYYKNTPSVLFILRHLLFPILIFIPLFVGSVLDVTWSREAEIIFISLTAVSFLIGLVQLFKCVILRFDASKIDWERSFMFSTYVMMSLRMVFVVAEFSMMDRWIKMSCDLIYAAFSTYTVIHGSILMTPPFSKEKRSVKIMIRELALFSEESVHPRKELIADGFYVDLPEGDMEQELTDAREVDKLGLLICEAVEKYELFRQPNLKVSTLCQYLPSNRTYVSAAINRMDPKGFYSFILAYRINYACTMIENDPMVKIEEVALQSGFSSQKIFSRLFRESKGISPSVYRGLQLNRVKSLNEE